MVWAADTRSGHGEFRKLPYNRVPGDDVGNSNRLEAARSLSFGQHCEWTRIVGASGLFDNGLRLALTQTNATNKAQDGTWHCSAGLRPSYKPSFEEALNCRHAT